MGTRQIVSLLVALNLVVATTFATTAPPRVSGDVNGDRHVDVLDIQAVIGGALTSQNPCQCTDVNGDGHTDVLDFQLTQARAVESSEEPILPSEGPPLEACYFAAPTLAPLWVERPIVDVVASAPRPAVHSPASDDCLRANDSRTQRYLYQLTPNAPPLLS